MELDDLKGPWAALDRRVGELEGMQRTLRRAALAEASRRVSRRRRLGPWLEIAFAAIVLLLLPGGFLAEHLARARGAPLGALPALVLCVTGVAIVAVAVTKLALLARVDFAGSVVDAQRAVARLWTVEVRETQLLLLAGLSLWVAFPLFALQRLAGFDAVFAVPAGWVAANVAFGVLAALALIAAARRLGARSSLMRAIDDAFAGRALVRLRAMAAELADFERP